MIHRHLKTEKWTLAAIDSALERGNLKDWRELFGEARRDKKIAESILRVVSRPAQSGAMKLARNLVVGIYPELLQTVMKMG